MPNEQVDRCCHVLRLTTQQCPRRQSRGHSVEMFAGAADGQQPRPLIPISKYLFPALQWRRGESNSRLTQLHPQRLRAYPID